MFKKNINYCKKDGRFQEFGCPPKCKRGIEHSPDIIDRIRGGATDEELLTEFREKILRGYRSVTWARRALRGAKTEARTVHPKVAWIRSCGMDIDVTDHIKDVTGEEEITCYWKDRTKWWDGYENQDCIIIEELNSKDWYYHDLYRLFGSQPIKVETKNGFEEFNSRYIVILEGAKCIYNEIEWHRLLGRIDAIYGWNKDGSMKIEMAEGIASC